MPTPYEALRRARPELFANEPGGFEILFGADEVEAARRAGSGTAEPAEPVGVVYADRFITVVRDAVRFPGGALGLYVRVLPASEAPGVVVLPLLAPATGDADADADPDAVRIVLVEHYRHATRAWHLEAPRGVGEPGASGAANAARELAEELGTEPRELIPLGDVHPDTGLLAGRVELFAARIDRIGPPETSEGIRRAVTLSPAAAADLIREGPLTDGFTIAALTRAWLSGVLAPARDVGGQKPAAAQSPAAP